MAQGRHSYVKFYPSDWIAGTARLPRILQSIYFDVCLYNWDHAEPLPHAGQSVLLGDVMGWENHVETLIEMGKLRRTKGRGLYCERALIEARSSIERLSNAVRSGKHGAAKRWKTKGKLDSHPIANQNQNQNQNVITLSLPLETKPPTSQKDKEITKRENDFQMPDWLDREAWKGWLEMRKASGWKATPRAKQLAVNRLERFRGQGHDPNKILDMATERNYRGLWPDDREGTTLAAGHKARITL